MSQTPAPTPPPIPAAPPAEPTGGYALFAGLGGLVFLYLSLPMITWFFSQDANPYGVTWPDGSPVAYRDLQGGAMWRDVGTLATALLLFDEAMLYFLANLRLQFRRPLLLAVGVSAALGIAVNALAAGLQIKAGFTAPLYALIGVVVFVLSLTTAMRLLRAR